MWYVYDESDPVEPFAGDIAHEVAHSSEGEDWHFAHYSWYGRSRRPLGELKPIKLFCVAYKVAQVSNSYRVVEEGEEMTLLRVDMAIR